MDMYLISLTIEQIKQLSASLSAAQMGAISVAAVSCSDEFDASNAAFVCLMLSTHSCWFPALGAMAINDFSDPNMSMAYFKVLEVCSSTETLLRSSDLQYNIEEKRNTYKIITKVVIDSLASIPIETVLSSS